MEHIAYCESKAKELDNLLAGNKNMLIRGATGRKLPHGRVSPGETVYLLENDGSGIIKAKGIVSDVFHSEALTPEESASLIESHMDRLKLTEAQKKRWSGKRFLCLVGLESITEVEPFSYVREKNMDDWIIVNTIDEVRG